MAQPFGLQWASPGSYALPPQAGADSAPGSPKAFKNVFGMPSEQANVMKPGFIDTLSETSTDGHSSDLDKYPVDADSMDSNDKSWDLAAFGYEMKVKNTFLELSPKATPKSSARFSKSVPPPLSLQSTT
jgi:hypothetical protein